MIGARLQLALLPPLAAGIVRVLGATLRVRIDGAEDVARLWRAGAPVIYAVWHGRILLVPWLSARLRRTHGVRSPTVLASRSRDGELAARYTERFELSVVRGSSSRGGDVGLRQLAAALRRGLDVAIVPDGPRGPSEQVQPGIVALAALTGAPVVPLAVGVRPCRRLGSWDRFLVPLPFGRCALVFGPAIHVERGADRDLRRKELERALIEVTSRADALAAGGRGA